MIKTGDIFWQHYLFLKLLSILLLFEGANTWGTMQGSRPFYKNLILEWCHFIKSKPQKAFLDVPSSIWMLYQIIFPFSIFAEGNINNGLDTLFLCSTAKDPFDCLSADLVNKNSFFLFKVRENSISSFWLLIQFCYCEKNNEHTNKIITL